MRSQKSNADMEDVLTTQPLTDLMMTVAMLGTIDVSCRHAGVCAIVPLEQDGDGSCFVISKMVFGIGLLVVVAAIGCGDPNVQQNAQSDPRTVIRQTMPSSTRPKNPKKGPELSKVPGVSIRKFKQTPEMWIGSRVKQGKFTAESDLFSILGFACPDETVLNEAQLPTELYTVSVEAPEGYSVGMDLRPHVWDKLVEAYQLSFHVTIKSVKEPRSIFVLEIGELGLTNVKLASEDEPERWSTRLGGFEFENQSWEELSTFLSENIDGVVVNETGDDKRYSFELKIKSFETELADKWMAAIEAIGLKLKEEKREMEFTIIKDVHIDDKRIADGDLGNVEDENGLASGDE